MPWNQFGCIATEHSSQLRLLLLLWGRPIVSNSIDNPPVASLMVFFWTANCHTLCFFLQHVQPNKRRNGAMHSLIQVKIAGMVLPAEVAGQACQTLSQIHLRQFTWCMKSLQKCMHQCVSLAHCQLLSMSSFSPSKLIGQNFVVGFQRISQTVL